MSSDDVATPALGVTTVPKRRSVESILLPVLLLAALAVRLVGIWHGLPQVYNADEESHFVPHAAAAADGHLDPHYLENPSAITYVIALALRLVFLGRSVEGLLGTDPGAVYLVGRLVVALLGTALVYVVFHVGKRFFDGTVGLLSGAIVGFAFLPVFYSHQALNDVPTMVGIAIVLLGAARVYETGDLGAYVLAGAGVGAAVASKYNAAPVCLVVAAACLLRMHVHPEERRASSIRALVIAGGVSLLVFVAFNPFFVLHLTSALHQVLHEGSQAGDAKLGQPGSPLSYYPRTLLWGLGAVPAVAAAGGAILGVVRGPRVRIALLLLFPVLLYLFVCTQGRFFARWLLPAYPALAVLAGYGVAEAGRWLSRRASQRVVWPVLAVLLLAQPIVDSVRSDVLLTHRDTRADALAYLRTHTHPGDRISVEPALPAHYLDGLGLQQLPVERPFQEYENRLSAATVTDLRSSGYCWVLTDSDQRGRGLAAGLPGAKAYYERLDREASSKAPFSPFRAGARPPRFSYDFSFDYYPWAFARPGPSVEIIRLRDCPAG